MRLGGPIDRSEYDSPDSWLEALTSRGYRAAFCPVPLDAPDAEVTAYREAAAAADIVIAEVGAGAVRSAPTTRRGSRPSKNASRRCPSRTASAPVAPST